MKKPDAAVAAIKFALHCDEPDVFLRLWFEGSFDAIRRDWDNVPDEVFIGADPLATPPAQEDGCHKNAPKGWKLLPVDLTAENGMKAALMGEFHVPLPELDEHGNEHILKINVPWTVIKKIHRAIVAAAPTPPVQENSYRPCMDGMPCECETPCDEPEHEA